MPCIKKIALHRRLQSLLVGVTDLDGRWMTYKASEIHDLVESCSELRTIGLTFPPLEETGEFLVSQGVPNLDLCSYTTTGQADRP
jgi:hypothetical protein